MSQNSQFFSASSNFYALSIGSQIENKYQEHMLTKNNDINKLSKAYEKYVDFLERRLEGDVDALTTTHREEWLNVMRELRLFKVCKRERERALFSSSCLVLK